MNPKTEFTDSHEAQLTDQQGNVQPVDSQSLSYARVKSSMGKRLIIFGCFFIATVIVLVGFFILWNRPKATPPGKTIASIDELRVGSLDGPIGEDYMYPNPIGAGQSLSINLQIFEGLVGYEDQKISPLLAESWKNPDESTWVFTLKPNVRFQNGKTVTAADVKQSLDTIVANEDWNYLFPTIKGVSINDNKTVTITTNTPDPLLLNRLVYGFITSTNADETLSSTGPYKFEHPKSPTETSATLIANDAYHQGAPKVKKIVFTIFEDTGTLNNALDTHKIDIGKDLQDKDLAAKLQSRGFTTISSEDADTYGLTMNLTKKVSPLNDKKVRQALAYAIDREALLKSDKSSRVPSNYILPKSVVGYDQAAELPATDTAKAKRLLADAKYSNEQITYIYIDGVQTVAPYIIEQLRGVGINVAAIAYDSPEEFVAAATAGDYDILGLSFSSDIGDGIDFFSSQLDSPKAQFPAVSDQAFSAMIQEAQKAFRANDHITKVQEINVYAANNFLWLPLSEGVSSFYYQKDLSLSIDSKISTSAVYYWKIGRIQTESASN